MFEGLDQVKLRIEIIETRIHGLMEEVKRLGIEYSYEKEKCEKKERKIEKQKLMLYNHTDN